MARRYDKNDAKRRILSVCVRMFIEKGYHDSKMAEILKEADVTSSTFHNIFPSKDSVLLELTEFMFDNQFGIARDMAGENADPVLFYAMETALQITLVEQNEHLREVYLEAYSQPECAELIYQKTSTELARIFGPYFPECGESDFYELEIGTSGIMCAYMSRPCDKYFTLHRKLNRFLQMSLSAYRVPPERQKEIISYLTGMDMVSIADAVMQKLFAALAMKYEFTLE